MKKNMLFLVTIVVSVALIGGLIIYDNSNRITIDESSEPVTTEPTTPTSTNTTTKTEKTIYCIGDEKNATYPQLLQSDTNIKTETITLQNASSDEIAQNLFASDVTVQSDFTIPAKKEAVEISLSNNSSLLNNGDIINPVTILDVTGQLTKQEDKFTFTRNTNGDEVSVPAGTTISTNFANKEKSDDSIYVIYANNHDELESSDNVSNNIAGINKIINGLNSDRYIVVGVTLQTKYPRALQINNSLASEFGDHFYNFRYDILVNDLTSYITWTEQDIEEIDMNQIPTSLLDNEGNENNEYYKLFSKCLANKIATLGY